MKFTIFEDDDIDPYLKLFEATQADAPTISDSGPTPMEQDQSAL